MSEREVWPPSINVGTRVRTLAHDYIGQVVDLHVGCPESDSWVAVQAPPIRPEALAPGYPWFAIALDAGGLVVVPGYDLATPDRTDH